MTVSKKLGMYAGVSAAALGLALITVPASAFDEVNWTWDAEVNEVITKTVNIDVDLNPSGMAMLENLQVSIGDHSASSSVNDVFNNQPGALNGNGGNGSLEFDVFWDTEGGRINGDNAFSDTELAFRPDDSITFFDLDGQEIGSDIVLGCIGGTELAETCTSQGFFTMVVEVDGEELVVMQEFDAMTDLPEVISTATAVANNTAIETDTSVQLHEGQFAFGGGSSIDFDGFDSLDGDLNGSNSNLVLAGALGTAAIMGMLDKANIDADSQVSNIQNATVDSTATAVVNNLSVDVAAEGNDRLLIGDVTQFSYADTNAMSDVLGVSISNYTNLGSIDRAIVNSVATAVGNNKSISVMAPSIGE